MRTGRREVRPRTGSVLRGGLILILLVVGLPAGRPARAARPAARSASSGRRTRRAPEVNSPPHAVNDTLPAFTNEGFQQLFVLDNDTDADGNPLLLTAVGYATHGAAVCCGSSGDFTAVNYDPYPNFKGTDTFTYTVTDGHAFDSATVTVNVDDAGTISRRTVIYAGTFDRLHLTVTPNGGAPNSPNNGACDGSAGMAIEDGELTVSHTTYSNPFDNGVTLWIDGDQVPPDLPMSVTHHSLTSGPVSMSGLNVNLAYYGDPGSFTLRTLLSLSNPTGASIAVTATLATNLGSDGSTGIRGTSSGDLSFDESDRWVITSDDPTNPGLAVSTHVLYGPGSPPVTTAAVFQSVFTCSGQQGIRARYHVTVPGGSTRRLLFFHQFSTSNQAALTDAAQFDAEPVGLLNGLSNQQLNQVVNWNVGPITRLFMPLIWR